MTHRLVPLATLLVAGCAPDASGPGRFTATVARAQLDTVRLTIPVIARPCAGGTGLVISGTAGGDGVLIWLGDSTAADTGAYTINTAADSVAGRHARVSLRFQTGDLARAVALDSGTVRLASDGATFAGSVTGSGSDPSAGDRPLVRGGFRGIAGGDSVPCRFGP